MKSAKFLIAENPIVNDSRIFVIHMRDPLIVAEAFHYGLDQEAQWMDCKRKFSTAASVDYPGELIVLGVVYCAPTELSADKLAKIMSRMGDWYYNYLRWEDT